MKGTYLGELEEMVLLMVGVLHPEAYGVAVMDELEARAGRRLNISGSSFRCSRPPEEKGFLKLKDERPYRGTRWPQKTYLLADRSRQAGIGRGERNAQSIVQPDTKSGVAISLVMKTKPPRWADQFLVWYCRSELLEEIQGDAHELFYRTAKKSEWKAKIGFVWNVLRFFRWKNIKDRKSSNNHQLSTAMFKNILLRVTFRNFLRQPQSFCFECRWLVCFVCQCISDFAFGSASNSVSIPFTRMLTSSTPW